MQRTAVTASPAVGAVGRVFLAFGTAQGIGLGIEQGVQGVLYCILDQSIDVLSHLALVDFDQFQIIAAIVRYTCHGSPRGYGPSGKSSTQP